MYQVGVHQQHQVLCQAQSHPRSIVQYLPWNQVQVHPLIQIKLQATNHQSCHPHPHQHRLLTIIALYHHMYQVGVHQQHQVLCQEHSHWGSLVQYLPCYQVQFHILIQVNLQLTNSQICQQQTHHQSLLPILSLYSECSHPRSLV